MERPRRKIEEKSCSGDTYADDYGSWNNVLVQGLIKITIMEEYAKVNLNNTKLHLNLGMTCKFSDEHCIDAQAGYAFWSHVINENCFENTPINVKIHHVKECYEELPVTSGNTTWFLTPKTHILIRTGT